MKPLKGRTVLVTRPKAQSVEAIRRLRALGARVLSAPAIKFAPARRRAPLDDALRRLASFDAVIFTSPNGVDWFFRRARRLLGRRPPRPSRLLAVGPGTARALAGHGWARAEVPRVHTGPSLAKRLGLARGKKILIPRAEDGREDLPRLLRRAGEDAGGGGARPR